MPPAPQLPEIWRITSEGDDGPQKYERDSVEGVLRAVRAALAERATLITIEKREVS